MQQRERERVREIERKRLRLTRTDKDSPSLLLSRGQRLKPASEGALTQQPSSGVGGVTSVKVEEMMSDLDQLCHAPDGVEVAMWERLVAARRRKVESELHTKRLALQLAEMNAFLSKRQAEDERLQQEIQDTFKDLKK